MDDRKHDDLDPRNDDSNDQGRETRDDSWSPPVYGQGSFDPDDRGNQRRNSRSEREPEKNPFPSYRTDMNQGPQRPGGSRQPDYRAVPTKTSPLVVLVAVLLTFVLTAGIFIGFIWNNMERFPGPGGPLTSPTPQQSGTDNDNTPDSLQAEIAGDDKLADILKILQDNYYRELTDEELLEAIVSGLPNSIDSPYTYYMTPDQHQAMQESIQGEYSGIGATVQMVTEGVYEVVEPTVGSPAQEVGLRPQDRFVSVDGIAAEEFATVTDLATAVKGETGTTVELEMYRPSTGETLTFEIERQPIISHPVSYRMQEDDLGYMQIREFSLNLPEEFQTAMRDMISQGAESIVFDMRNNPGGAADSAIKVLDYLLPEGVIATVRGRQNGEETEYNWTSDESMFVPEDMNYIILVNRNSASASELFTGALRDWDKAHIIGEQTYGKGSGTVAYELEDGSAVNVTIFNYYLPAGELIEGEGIAPDQEVSLSPENSVKLISELTLEEDEQLQAAIEYWNNSKND